MFQKTLVALACTSVLAACASTGGDEPMGAPDYTLVPQGVQTEQARLYGACLNQATRRMTYGRSHDPSTELIRFNCDGQPAQRFYEALEQRSLDVDSRWEADGWSYRSTNKVRRDLFGVDWCGADNKGAYICVINLNVGPFAAPRP